MFLHTRMKSSKNLDYLVGHDGFVSPSYAPGKKTADALLLSGSLLLCNHSLAEVTVEQICAGANVTTGAFYRRFLSKDAYFKALQAFAIEDSKLAHTNLMKQLDEFEYAASEGIALVVSCVRRWYCQHEGVIRASQMQRSVDALSWEPIKQLGSLNVSEIVKRVEKMTGLTNTPALSHRISFGFQVVFGTMVNAVINNPGPIDLHNKELDDELTRLFYAYLRDS